MDALRQGSGNQYPNKERDDLKGQSREEVKDQGSFSSISLSFIRFGTACQRLSIIKTEGQASPERAKNKEQARCQGQGHATPPVDGLEHLKKQL